MSLPTAEDVIVQKLRWGTIAGRKKDILDAEGIVKVRRDRLDWRYVEKWCEALGLGQALEDLALLKNLWAV